MGCLSCVFLFSALCFLFSAFCSLPSALGSPFTILYSQLAQNRKLKTEKTTVYVSKVPTDILHNRISSMALLNLSTAVQL